MTRLFVYGTLKRGAENNAHLEGQRFLGEAVTVPGYVLYGLFGYPGMVRAADVTAGVTGELWEIDDDTYGSTPHDLECFEDVKATLLQRTNIK